MEIRELDPYDEATTRTFWEIGKAADEVGRPWSTYWPWETARAAFTHRSTSMRKTLLAAFEGDRLVGSSEVSFPLLDNVHTAFPEIFVHPDHQRRGAGSALLRASEDVARASGRSVLMAEVATPISGPESAGVQFARLRGFVPVLVDEIKVVDLVATRTLWDVSAVETAAGAAGYALRGWRDVCPEDVIDGYCRLLESFNIEAPTGDLDIEPERWDKDRVREKEERFRRSGRHEVSAVALALDGSVAGFTEVMMSEHRPRLGLQGGTMVAREHRGHGLGVALKVFNHDAVRRAYPECTHLLTGNADVNHHMNTVNDRLGYHSVERVVEMQKQLS